MSPAIAQPAVPMFYRGLTALDPALHLGWGLRGQAHFSIAAAANAVPLGVGEFWHASAHYPIVFGPAGASGFPIAITALVEGRNLFVDAAGQWLAGSYVPAWLRRYPFWMQPDPDGQNASFWFDPHAQQLVPLHEDADARPLFDYQGNPNQTLAQIVQFCQQCQNDANHSYAFMQALEHHRLLVDRQATVELLPGKPYTLGGFRMVDMDAYHRLPDAVLASWVRKGWASLVALHHISVQQNWERLLVLHRSQNG
ncbi:SapC family protein [Comamonas sp. B-9]|uniref:SapC family protein n=1 Tax=Comamonas sp. B-9 TaxID=1055192 RepID=UPI00047C738F|nr:SapC family protein [Comamonas sp. B-9]